MKLSQEQINYLFSFCSEQGIDHYDVQIEMVDHFTEWIETNWEKQPAENFLFMIAQVRQAFSKEELKVILTEKKKNINKLVSRMIEKEFVSFFTPPKVIITTSLLLSCYLMPYLIDRLGFAVFIAFLIVIAAVVIPLVNPLDKEVKAIKAAKVLPLLSLKIKNKYEIIAQVIQISISLLMAAFFLFRSEHPVEKTAHLSADKILKMQFLFTFSTIYLIFNLAILHVRKRFYTKVFYNYPKAFAS